MERSGRPTLEVEPGTKPGWWQTLIDQIAGMFHSQDEPSQELIERPLMGIEVESEPDTAQVTHNLPVEPELTVGAPTLTEHELWHRTDAVGEQLSGDELSSELPVPELSVDTEPQPVVDDPSNDLDCDGQGTVTVLEPVPDESAVTEPSEPELDTEPQPITDEVELTAPDQEHNDPEVTPAPEVALDEPDDADTDPALTCCQDDQCLDSDPGPTPDQQPVIAGDDTPSDRGSWFGRPRAWLSGKQELARKWIAELRSGRHEQVCGAWEDGTRECTIQVARNTFHMSYDNLEDKFGERFLNEILHRNDRLHQPFKQIANFMERELELDR